MLANFKGRGGEVLVGPQVSACLRRDDRPGGITDQFTWGVVCFYGSDPPPPHTSVVTMNYQVQFKDTKDFGPKRIARTCTTDVLDYKATLSVNEVGKLTGEGYGRPLTSPTSAVVVNGSLRGCHFAPLLRNGIATCYHGEVLVAH